MNFHKKVSICLICLVLMLVMILPRLASGQSDSIRQVVFDWYDLENKYGTRPESVQLTVYGYTFNPEYIITDEITLDFNDQNCDQTGEPNKWTCELDTAAPPFDTLENFESSMSLRITDCSLNAVYARNLINEFIGSSPLRCTLSKGRLRLVLLDAYTFEDMSSVDFRLHGTSLIGLPVDMSMHYEQWYDVFPDYEYEPTEDWPYPQIPGGTFTLSGQAIGYVIPDHEVTFRYDGGGNPSTYQFYAVKKDNLHTLTVGKTSSESDVEYEFTVELKSAFVFMPPLGKGVSTLETTLSFSDVRWKKYGADGSLLDSGLLSNYTHEIDLDRYNDAEEKAQGNPKIDPYYDIVNFEYYQKNYYPKVDASETFKLKSGECIVFEDIADGTSFTVIETPMSGYITTINGDDQGVIDGSDVEVTFDNTKLIDISGSKTWDDAEDQDGIRPDSITIRLMVGNEEVKNTTASAPDWNWSFEGLPKNKDGNAIVYTIKEDPVTGYTPTINGYNVTNSHVSEKINISGSKTWDDAEDQDGIRPDSITIRLLADDEEVKNTTASAPDWNWTFEGLPKNKDGSAIVYTISEDPVEGYEAAVDGYNVTNSHEPEKINISGSKTWDDAEDQDGIRPDSITIRLLADDEEVKNTTASAPDWNWSFEGLPKNKDGMAINYTITEDPVTDYETMVDGYNVTNSHEPEKTDISVSKVWDDDDDQDRIRPASVTVQLLANGEDTGHSAVLDENNGWYAEFNDLFVYANGEAIDYTVEEVLTDIITGEDGWGTYAVEVSGSAEGSFTVTNRHTPLLIDIEAVKVWHDNNNKNGKRPAQVSVELYANGEATGNILTLSEANSWRGSFTGLLKHRDGTEVVYSIEELDLPSGYNVNYFGSAEEGRLGIINNEKPTPPPFFEIEKELPKTGITLPPAMLAEKPNSISYRPMNMDLMIPSLDLSMGIVEVNEIDGEYPVQWLGMNAGLLEGASLPGEGPAVIVGHNTLNSEDYGPFVRISMLNPGDRFFIRTANDRIMGFEIYTNEKIASHDVQKLYRIASQFESTVTLMTCEDELPEGGYASRRIVTARQVL